MKTGKLKILHLFTHSAVTRGGAVQGLLLATMQHQKGHDVTCIFHKPFFKQSDDTLKNKDFGFKLFLKNMKNPLSYMWLSRFLSRNNPHVIHCHRNLALLYGFFSSRWLGITFSAPVLIINRGTTYDLPNPIVRFVFHSEGLDHIIAVSEAVKEKLVVHEGIAADRITVIYGSYDDSRFRPGVDGTEFRKRFKLDEDTPVITCVAAVDRRKGIEHLIDAALIILKERPDAHFFVVGAIEDKHYYKFLRKLVFKYNLSDRFHFLGHRDDVHIILAATDVSVSASVEGEGITGALRESLAMKKPVVATNVSGNHEIIRDGDTGWLVPPGDAESLAKAIREVLADRDEAVKRAERGYNLVRELCSPDARYDKVLRLYKKLIRARRVI